MVDKIATDIINCFKRGNKLLICGNGGSATMASHMVGEFMGKFEMERDPLPAISLFDLATITAIANDYSYDDIFSRQVQALGQKGDILICLTTSGKSKNLIKAQDIAIERGMGLVMLPMPNMLSTAGIQEYQLNVIHEICRIVEREMFKTKTIL